MPEKGTSGSKWAANHLADLNITTDFDKPTHTAEGMRIAGCLSFLTERGVKHDSMRLGDGFVSMAWDLIGQSQAFASRSQYQLTKKAREYSAFIIGLATATQVWKGFTSQENEEVPPRRLRSMPSRSQQQRISDIVGPSTPTPATAQIQFAQTPAKESKQRSKPEILTNKLAIDFLQSALNTSRYREAQTGKRPQFEWEGVPMRTTVKYKTESGEEREEIVINDGTLVLKGLRTFGKRKKIIWMKAEDNNLAACSLEVVNHQRLLKHDGFS
jgi:hypothetical protein